MRKFRFGAQVSRAPSGAVWTDMARSIADMGYATLLMPDHFSAHLGPFVALTAAALAAPTLRIGTLVFDNDFRHPAELAKEAATLDMISEGRLELGIGAGWARTDYERSGIPYDPPAQRVERFSEALTIIKGLFAEGTFSYSGKYYQITDLEGMPKPVQKPYPPLLIGAGRPRMLSIAAREADIVNVTFSMQSGEWDAAASATGTAEATTQKMAALKKAAGERFESLELSVPVFVADITDKPMEIAERIAPRFGISANDVLGSPHFLIGSVDSIVEELVERRKEHGISYLVFGQEAYQPLAPVVARLAGT